jgi:hypothetical protein
MTMKTTMEGFPLERSPLYHILVFCTQTYKILELICNICHCFSKEIVEYVVEFEAKELGQRGSN